MITEDYISFETAKFLQEKGFDAPCLSYFWTEENGANISYCETPFTNQQLYSGQTLRPTLQMAMKWLRKEHNIHAEVRIINHLSSSLIVVPRYYWIILNVKEVKWMDESTAHESKSYETFEEAREAAIKYCLENLI